ncbi:sporulation protein YtxC [Salinibacillus xinjiangensis]|nr:sporulation protein YtxC [Salinibacillus xinjiangensis]
MGLVIHFFRKDEAETFYYKLNREKLASKIHFEIEEGKTCFIKVDMQPEKMNDTWKRVIHALIFVFIQYRLPTLAKGILKKYYYYQNQLEIMQITPILQSVLHNPRKYGTQPDVQSASNFYQLFEEKVTRSPVLSFDQLVDEQEEFFAGHLIDVTGYAIEEWKREQDYQDFIHRLRDFFRERTPKTNLLIITYHHEFQFYRENGRRYSTSELKALQNKESLHFIDLLSSEFPLSSLVGIAPESVLIYTTKPSDPKIIFLQNIFQESVRVMSIEKFPFVGKKA